MSSPETVEHLLSCGKLAPPAYRKCALDVGCGPGFATIDRAEAQPEIDFVGIDGSRATFAEAETQVGSRNLVNLQFLEANPRTLIGLQVPDGGYDAIYCSSALDNWRDLGVTLSALRAALAPHGVIRLTLESGPAPDPNIRFSRAIDLSIVREKPLPMRIAVGREIVNAAAPAGSPLGDAEFVDRYLKLHHVFLDELVSTFTVLEAAKLRFLRWCEPEIWSLKDTFPKIGPVPLSLPPDKRFQVLQYVRPQKTFELIVCHAANEPKPRPRRSAVLATIFAVDPRLRTFAPARPDPAITEIIKMLGSPIGPFPGEALVGDLGTRGMAPDLVIDGILDLATRGLLYCPWV